MPKKTPPLAPAAAAFHRAAVRRLSRTLRELLQDVPPDAAYFKVEIITDHGPGQERGLLCLRLVSCALKGEALEQVALEIPRARAGEFLRALAPAGEPGRIQ